MFTNFLFDLIKFSDSLSNDNKVNNQDFTIKLAVPGYGKEDINIDIIGNTIKISSKDFEENFSLPDNADIDNIKATCDKGILKVTVPTIKKSLRSIKVE